MVQAPCKNCPDRHRNCWSKCEKFQEFRAARDDLAKKRESFRKCEDDFYRVIQRRR